MICVHGLKLTREGGDCVGVYGCRKCVCVWVERL